MGGFLGVQLLSNPLPMVVAPTLAADLSNYGITDYTGLVPSELFKTADSSLV